MVTYSQTVVWAEVGGAVRLARNARAWVSDPISGDPVDATQGGRTASYVDTDSAGRCSFTAASWPVRIASSLATGAPSVIVMPVEAPTLLATAVSGAAASAATASAAVDTIDETIATWAVDTSDSAVATLFGSGTATRTAAAEVYAPVGNVQATARKIADGFADVTITLLGDSTTAIIVPNLAAALAAIAPHRSVRVYTWDGDTHTYGAPETVATGTGSAWINVYHGGKGGTIWDYALAAAGPHWIDTAPDCVVLNFGLNQGATATPDARLDYHARLQRLALAVRTELPDADLLLMSQNPRMDAGYQTDLATVRAQAVRSVASEMGAGYGPVTEAYLAAGDPSALLLADHIHPSSAGAALIASTLAPLFRVDLRSQPSARIPSSLLTPAPVLVRNGEFGSWGTPVPEWASANATLSRDFTHHEAANPSNTWSLRIQAAGAAQSRIEQYLPVSILRGHTITVAARMYLPAGQTSTVGRVEIYDGTTVSISRGVDVSVRDVWYWEYLTVKVPASATSLRLRVIAGYLTSDTAADVSVARVTCAIGGQPKDAGQEAALGFGTATPQRLGTEAAGTSQLGARADHVHSRILTSNAVLPVQSADPASPVEGEMWHTSAGLFIWHGGAKKAVTLT